MKNDNHDNHTEYTDYLSFRSGGLCVDWRAILVKVRNHDLTPENIPEWGTGTLKKDKDFLLSSDVNIKESLLLVRLINVELKRRETHDVADSLANSARELILEEDWRA